MKFMFSIVLLTAFVFLAVTQTMAEDTKQAVQSPAEPKAVEAPPVGANTTVPANTANNTATPNELEKAKDEKQADNSTKTSRR